MAWVSTGLASSLGSTSLTALELASESRSESAWVPDSEMSTVPVPASCLATESEMPTVSLTG